MISNTGLLFWATLYVYSQLKPFIAVSICCGGCGVMRYRVRLTYDGMCAWFT